MQKGKLVASGSPHAIVQKHQRMASSDQVAAMAGAVRPDRPAGARIFAVTFHDEAGDEILNASTGCPMLTRVHYDAWEPVEDAVIEVFYYSREGRTLLCKQSTALAGDEQLALRRGKGAVEFVMSEVGLQPGAYSVGATIRGRSSASTIDWFYGRTLLYVDSGRSVRSYFTPHEWREVPIVSDAGGTRTLRRGTTMPSVPA